MGSVPYPIVSDNKEAAIMDWSIYFSLGICGIFLLLSAWFLWDAVKNGEK